MFCRFPDLKSKKSAEPPYNGVIYLMSSKKLISLLVVSAVLCAPVVARASDMALLPNRARVTIGADGGIQIESRGPVVTNSAHQGPGLFHSR